MYKSPKDILTIAVMTLVFNNCAHNKSTVRSVEETAGSNCEQMTKNILEEHQKDSILSDALTVTSKSVAYSATAAGVLLDYTVFLGVGIASLAVLCPDIVIGGPACLPARLLSGSSHSATNGDGSRASPSHKKPEKGPPPSGNVSPDDPAARTSDEEKPGFFLGPGIYDATKPLREDTKAIEISRAFRNSARCFALRDDPKNLEKAYLQMKWLSNSPLYNQVSASERHQINEQSHWIKYALLARYPSFEQDLQRKNRALVADLLKRASPPKDWQSPSDGSMWRLLQVEVPTADVAKIACSYLDEIGGNSKNASWRIPTKKELEKALASGLLSAHPEWATGDKTMRIFAITSISPPKVDQFTIKGGDLIEVQDPSSLANLLCVF